MKRRYKKYCIYRGVVYKRVVPVLTQGSYCNSCDAYEDCHQFQKDTDYHLTLCEWKFPVSYCIEVLERKFELSLSKWFIKRKLTPKS